MRERASAATVEEEEVEALRRVELRMLVVVVGEVCPIGRS